MKNNDIYNLLVFKGCPNYIKIVIFVIALISYTYVDYKVSFYFVMQNKINELNKYKNDIVGDFREDIERILYLKDSGQKIRYNFLNEVRIISDLEGKTISQDFLIIKLIKKAVIVSPTIIVTKLKKILPTNIGINILDKNEYRNEFGYSTAEIVKDGLYLNLWLKNTYVQRTSNELLIISFMKSLVFQLFGSILIYYYINYRKKEINSYLQSEYKDLDNSIQNKDLLIHTLTGENGLLKKFVNVEEYNLDSEFIKSFSIDLEEYFFSKIKSLNSYILINQEIKLKIKKGDFCNIIFSIMYHKMQSLNKLEVLITFKIENNDFIFLIQDNGFKFNINQLSKYSIKGKAKPQMVMDWLLIMVYFKDNNITIENNVDGDLNTMKVVFPMVSSLNAQNNNNVCYFKDYQK